MNLPPAPSSVDVLLFDLGRVVLDINFDHGDGELGRARRLRARRPRQRVSSSTTASSITRPAGSTTPRSLQSLRQSLGIGLTDAQFLEGWNAIFTGEMPGIAPLLAGAAQRLPLYAFSNTNPAHVAHFSKAYADVLSHFREIFLSSSIGLRKPDAEAYDHVVKAIGVPASRILFFDDSAANIEGARARGLCAIHVTSMDDVARALTALEV